MGRRDDFSEYAAARAPRLRSMAYLLCGNWHTAEDLTQVTLTKLYVAWPRVRRGGTVDAYARQVLVRSFLSERRKLSSTEVPIGTVPDTAGPETSTDDRVALVQALAELPDRQRAVLILRFWEDLDVATTAAALSCSEGTVKSSTSRALAALREVLHRHDLFLPIGEPV
jgi:RNA polymerase sigma-70 factor (sigma-E family)